MKSRTSLEMQLTLAQGHQAANVQSEATVRFHLLRGPVGELGIGRWLQTLPEEYY